MKKTTTFLFVTVLFLCGCGESTSPVGNQKSQLTADGPDSEAAQASNSKGAKDESTETNAPPAESTKSNEPSSQATPSGEVVDITFDDIKLPIQEDIVFRPFMLTDRAKQLDGQRVRISGFMLADAKTRGIEQFVLLKNTECKFGPGGQADHLVNVIMNDGQSTIFRNDAVAVEGVITVNPFNGIDGNTWSIYDLTCDRVKKHRSRR